MGSVGGSVVGSSVVGGCEVGGSDVSGVVGSSVDGSVYVPPSLPLPPGSMSGVLGSSDGCLLGLSSFDGDGDCVVGVLCFWFWSLVFSIAKATPTAMAIIASAAISQILPRPLLADRGPPSKPPSSSRIPGVRIGCAVVWPASGCGSAVVAAEPLDGV